MDRQKNYGKIAFALGALLWVAGIAAVSFFDYKNFEILNVKIITYVQILSFLLFANAVLKLRDYIHPKHIDFAIIIAFAIVMLSLFEMLWSFNYWFSTYQIQVTQESISSDIKSLDNVSYTLDSDTQPSFVDKFKLNYSAKKNTLFFISSLYLLYILLDLKYQRRNK